jgi:transposase-like protein
MRLQQYANNRVEADHGRLKSRLRPIRGLKCYESARTLAADLALRRTSGAATTT